MNMVDILRDRMRVIYRGFKDGILEGEIEKWNQEVNECLAKGWLLFSTTITPYYLVAALIKHDKL